MPDTPVQPMTARLVHQIPGRVRMRLQGEPAEIEDLERLADAIAAMPGVRRVDIRAETGSILIRHTGSFDGIADRFGAVGLALLPALVEEAIDPIGDMSRELGDVGAAFGELTGGRADIWGVAFLGLVGIGLWQLANGRVAGPALTVLGQAATIAMARPYRPSKPK